jgi:3-methyl-2-oxobutanoate hydroxymethyltransferase
MPYSSTAAQSPLTTPVTITTLNAMRANAEKFITVALYDAPMAAMAQRCGVEVLLVGDSLGMTVLGYESTIPVTMEQMIYHIEAVARGNDKSRIMGDMTFMTYATPELAIENATRIMQAGANMVKLEGGQWLAPIVPMLSERGIPVCGHLGLTPQSVNKLGGYKVQGKTDEQAEQIVRDALALDQAGADLLVLECVPSSVAQRVTESVSMPTIGIGAGQQCDAQVLVINDILGLTEKPPKFSKNFLKEAGDIPSALHQYARDVKSGVFPADEHSFK